MTTKLVKSNEPNSEASHKGKIPPRKNKQRFEKNPIRRMVAFVTDPDKKLLLVKSDNPGKDEPKQLQLPGRHQPGTPQRRKLLLIKQVKKLTGLTVTIDQCVDVKNFAHRSIAIYIAEMPTCQQTTTNVAELVPLKVLTTFTPKKQTIELHGETYFIPDFVLSVINDYISGKYKENITRIG